MLPTMWKAGSARSSCVPSMISWKERMVSLRGTNFPGVPVKASATKKGCDSILWIRRARATTRLTAVRGRAISEEVVIKDGEILNPSLTTYLMPMAVDVPSIENILVEVPAEDGPFGARVVAEPPGFGPPAAIANAIEDAVGVRLKSLPLSADKILRALRGETTEATNIDPELLQRLRQ